MKHPWELVAAAVFLASSADASAAVLSDTTPPKLRTFHFSPAVVDTSTNAQIITITARATDDLSGMTGFDVFGHPFPRKLSVSFFSPYIGAGVSLSASLFASAVIPVDPLDITWTGELVVPQYAHAGTWTLAEIRIDDSAGNAGRFSFLDAQALGLPTTFKVTGLEDRTPPQLLSLTLETNKIETSSSQKSVKFTGLIREDLSGFGHLDSFGRPVPALVFVRLTGPSKTEVEGRAFVGSTTRFGNQLEGFIDFPPYAEAGLWRLQSLHCADRVGNSLSIARAPELASTFTIEVIGRGDTNAPQLRALTFSPRRIDTSTNWQVVTLSGQLLDDLSGTHATFSGISFTGGASAAFQSPSKNQQVSAFLFASGNPTNAEILGTVFFPQYSEAGVWTLRSFVFKDLAGNRVAYESSDLRRLGFPTELAIGVAPQLSIDLQGSAILFSWPAWAYDMNVETSVTLSAGPWQRPQSSPSIIGEKSALVVMPSNNQQFYRLAAAD